MNGERKCLVKKKHSDAVIISDDIHKPQPVLVAAFFAAFCPANPNACVNKLAVCPAAALLLRSGHARVPLLAIFLFHTSYNHTMELKKIARCFYAIALIVYGIQQFVYSSFRPVFVPNWPGLADASPVWAWLFGMILIAVAVMILFGWYGRQASLCLGVLLLGLVIFVHTPFELLMDPYYRHLGSWANALKALALAGGAWVLAGSYNSEFPQEDHGLFDKLIQPGRIFFAVTMIAFGIAHFLYTVFIEKLVPTWIPFATGWTLIAGAVLIVLGIAIIGKIWLRPAAFILAAVLMVWLFVLHIPRAIADPYASRGNEVASTFDNLAFCGTSLLLGLLQQQQPRKQQ